MALEEALKCISAEAGDDLSADQYKPVKMDADGQVTICDTLGQRMYGVLQDNPDAAGRVGSIAISGITKLVAGDTITAGDQVVCDASALGIVVSAADQWTIGIAETDAVVGDIFSVLIGVALTLAP